MNKSLSLAIFLLVCVGMPTAGAANFLANVGFDEVYDSPTGDSLARYWYTYGRAYKSVSEGCRSGNCLYFKNPNTNIQSGAFQQISRCDDPSSDACLFQDFQHVAGQTIRITAWSKAINVIESDEENMAAASRAGYSIYADLMYEDGTWEWGNTISSFESGTHDWEQVTAFASPKQAGKAVKKMNVYLLFRYNSGEVYFDDISAECYTPDVSLEQSTLSMNSAEVPTGQKARAKLFIKDQFGRFFEDESLSITASVSNGAPTTVTRTVPSSAAEFDISFESGLDTVDVTLSVKVNNADVNASPMLVHVKPLRFNYVQDPGFDEELPNVWGLQGDGASVVSDSCHEGTANCLRMAPTGTVSTPILAGQWSIPVRQTVASQLILSAHYKYMKSGFGAYCAADIFYSDGSTQWSVMITPIMNAVATDGWKYAETVFTPESPINAVSIYCIMRDEDSHGIAYFDSVGVFKPAMNVVDASKSELDVGGTAELAVASNGVKTINILAKDANGIIITDGGENFAARLVRRLDGATTTMTVTDGGAGLYSLSVSPPSAGTFDLHVDLDGIPLKNSPLTVNGFNTLGSVVNLHPGFEAPDAVLAAVWTQRGEHCSVVDTVAAMGTKSLECASNNGLTNMGVTQSVVVNQAKPSPLLVSASARVDYVAGIAADGSNFGIRVVVTDANNQVSTHFAAFDANSLTAWQTVSIPLSSLVSFVTMDVSLVFDGAVGTVHFDDVSVITSQARGSAAHTYGSGPGLTSSAVGQPTIFEIFVQDSYGRALEGGVNPSDIMDVTIDTTDFTGIAVSTPAHVESVSMTKGIYRVTYTPTSHGRKSINMRLNGEHIKGSPTVVYVMPSTSDTQSELLANPGFQDTDGPWISNWWGYSSGFTIAQEDHLCRNPPCAYVNNGNGGLGQLVEIPDEHSEKPLTLSGWSKAVGVGGDPKPASYALYMDLVYADGSNQWGIAKSFESGTHDWEYQEVTFVPIKKVVKAYAYVFLRSGRTGVAYFDDMSLRNSAPEAVSFTSSITRQAAVGVEFAVGNEETFWVRVNDRQGTPVPNTQEAWRHVTMEVTRISGCDTSNDAVDHTLEISANGGALLKFTPVDAGEYFINVKIKGAHVAGSPMAYATAAYQVPLSEVGNLDVQSGFSQEASSNTGTEEENDEFWLGDGFGPHAVTALVSVAVSWIAGSVMLAAIVGVKKGSAVYRLVSMVKQD